MTGEDIVVCGKEFREILEITPARVNSIIKSYMKTGGLLREKRGGDHTSEKFLARKKAVKDFISSLKCIESHYCRNNSQRAYLPSDLNINLLAKAYNNGVDNSLKVKPSYFRHVFNRCFNLGFGTPRVDVCSTCTELSEKKKVETDPCEKSELNVKLAIHKKRAKAFFSLLKDTDPKVKILSFDCQKNLPNPKIPDQETYYRRQLYLYNFSIVVGNSKTQLNPTTCFSYVWTEDAYQKGSNEIAFV